MSILDEESAYTRFDDSMPNWVLWLFDALAASSGAGSPLGLVPTRAYQVLRHLLCANQPHVRYYIPPEHWDEGIRILVEMEFITPGDGELLRAWADEYMLLLGVV